MEFGKRLSYAFRCFFGVLSKGEVPDEIAPEVIKETTTPTPARAPDTAPAVAPPAAASTVAPPAAESVDRAVQMLALLQRDGRLIDFLTEDIGAYQDAQIGAAVRDVHASCRQVLDRYVNLEPVLASEEGQPVTVAPGFSPAAIKLIGNVAGQPPLRGLLRHRGWRAASVNLPPLAAGDGRAIVAPAEVEIM